MSERKNLDRLFQEKFKDFEAEPSELAWKNIEARLEEKKDRKVIPIWFRLAGAAAVLLVGMLLVFNWNGNSGQNPKSDQVVSAPEKGGNEKANAKSAVGNETFRQPANAVTDNGDPHGRSAGADRSTEGLGNAEKSSGANASGADSKNAERSRKGAGNEKRNDLASPNTAVANVANESAKNRRSTKANKASNDDVSASGGSGIRQENSGIALYPEKKAKNKSARKGKAGVSQKGLNPLESHNVQYASSDKKAKKPKHVKSRANSTEALQVAQNTGKSGNPTNKENNSINDKIAVNENKQSGNTQNQGVTAKTTSTQAVAAKTDDTKKDSTALAMAAEPNALEELLKNEKEKDKSVTQNEQKMDRWQVSPRIAPIYLSSSSKGSPIDSRFAANDKDYKTQVSYGMGVSYAVSKKLSVRTGVNSLSFQYNTNNVVAVQSSVARQQLEHVNPTVQGAFLRIENKESGPGALEITNSGNVVKEFSSSLNQMTGYIEVPVELSYKVLDKRFGINVIGGISTLFLNQNEVSVISDGNEMQVGKANNLNETSFSTNVGLGFKYDIWKSLQFSFEPMFKYQLNTYSESGNFKPYFFGLYTGLNYRF